jgi:hypothetical protein
MLLIQIIKKVSKYSFYFKVLKSALLVQFIIVVNLIINYVI